MELDAVRTFLHFHEMCSDRGRGGGRVSDPHTLSTLTFWRLCAGSQMSHGSFPESPGLGCCMACERVQEKRRRQNQGGDHIIHLINSIVTLTWIASLFWAERQRKNKRVPGKRTIKTNLLPAFYRFFVCLRLQIFCFYILTMWKIIFTHLVDPCNRNTNHQGCNWVAFKSF